MRAFVAMTLPLAIRECLAALQHNLEQARVDVKWVEPDHLHLTLKFLGDITEEQRHRVEHALADIAARSTPFSCRLNGVGAFPSLDAPRVIWVGVAEGRDPARELAQALESATRPFNLPAETRPFEAHVTLGRVRSPRRRQALTQALRGVLWQPPAAWQVTSVTLYESVLSSDGPRYNVLAEIPLVGAERDR